MSDRIATFLEYLATFLERLSWILEDVAERIDHGAAAKEATRQSRLGRDPLIGFDQTRKDHT